MPLFNIWMIVFEKNKKRLENYERLNKKFNCIKFSAIDTINYFNKYSRIALEKNYTTKDYLKEISNIHGKLGCNLSHQILLEKILKESNTDWNLIIEDDIDLINYDLSKINKIIEKANENNSNYIQLYTHKKFLNKQINSEKIYDNLYKMINQWGTVAYFINKKGIKIFKDNFPIDKNIDFYFNTLIPNLNSLCWINNIFINQGSADGSRQELKYKYGSLIWNSKYN